MPPSAIARAKAVLAKLEAGRDATGGIAAGLDELPLFASLEPQPADDPLTEAIDALEPDQLTPREALDALYALKRLVGE
jgi:DNA mismatch repair protein MutS